MRWVRSWRADPRVRAVADRHYNRQKVGAPQFVPPGSCLVLRTPESGAMWVTSWPIAEYVKHRWGGYWVNSAFRNERPDLYRSSELIREAVAATRAWYGGRPVPGMVSFVDPRKVRRKRDPGRCFVRAGFEYDGTTVQDGLLAFVLRPERMPESCAALDEQVALLGDVA